MTALGTHGVLRRVHLWLSVITAVPLAVLCVTGALLVFNSEIESALEPDAWTATPDGRMESLPYKALLDGVARRKPGARVWSVYMPPQDNSAWRLWLSGGDGVLHLDPYSGRILKDYQPKSTVSGLIAGMHRWFLIDGPARKWVRHAVSIVTLMLIVQVVLGIALWAASPSRLRRLKPDFSRGAQVAVLSLHNLFGLLTGALIVLIAFTGMSLWWHDGTRGVVETVTQSTVEKPPEPDTASLAPVADLDATIALGRSMFPDLALRSFRPPAQPGDPVLLRLANPEDALTRQVWVGDDPARVLAVFRPDHASPATTFWHLRGALHSGAFGGWPVRLIWALLSLAPVGFLASGLWLYWKRGGLRRRRAKDATRS